MIRWCDACPTTHQSAGTYPVGTLWLCVDHLAEASADTEEPSGRDSWAIRARIRRVVEIQEAARDAHAQLSRELVDVLRVEREQRAIQLHCQSRFADGLEFQATRWEAQLGGEYSFVACRNANGTPTFWLAVWQLVRGGRGHKPRMDLLGGAPPPPVKLTASRLYIHAEIERELGDE